jgi:hypothetical protein
MSVERIREIGRQFPENGMKLLLQQLGNLRDLLSLAEAPLLDRIAFDQLSVDPTTYVTADFRHVSSDLVLRAPLRRQRGARRGRMLSLTILIEHQSEPERLMLLRVLDYLVQIWKSQARSWGQEHGSLASVHLQPILPVVFYTGLHRWERLGGLLDLMPQAEPFRAVTPEFRPLFVNLPELAGERLAGAGYFGWLLRLVQQRKARARGFSELLGQAVSHLETMPADDRLRWLEMLSYVQALVYHDRAGREHQDLDALIQASLRTDQHRQEAEVARQTIADMLREEGQRHEAIRSRQQMLLMLLSERFGALPGEVEKAIEGTKDQSRLDGWLRQVVRAARLEDLDFGAER